MEIPGFSNVPSLTIPRKRKTSIDGVAAFKEFVDGIIKLAEKAEELDVPMVAYAHYSLLNGSTEQDHLALRVMPRKHLPTTEDKTI